jgi:hypothetical protein
VSRAPLLESENIAGALSNSTAPASEFIDALVMHRTPRRIRPPLEGGPEASYLVVPVRASHQGCCASTPSRAYVIDYSNWAIPRRPLWDLNARHIRRPPRPALGHEIKAMQSAVVMVSALAEPRDFTTVTPVTPIGPGRRADDDAHPAPLGPCPSTPVARAPRIE